MSTKGSKDQRFDLPGLRKQSRRHGDKQSTEDLNPHSGCKTLWRCYALLESPRDTRRYQGPLLWRFVCALVSCCISLCQLGGYSDTAFKIQVSIERWSCGKYLVVTSAHSGSGIARYRYSAILKRPVRVWLLVDSYQQANRVSTTLHCSMVSFEEELCIYNILAISSGKTPWISTKGRYKVDTVLAF